jgi:hypothetical protein
VGKVEPYIRNVKSRILSYDITFDLKIRVTDQPRLTELEEHSILKVELDSEEILENLDGQWKAKKLRTVFLYFYEDFELEDTALAYSQSSLDVKAFLSALGHISSVIRPQRLKLKFLGDKDFLKKINELGNIGWIVISHIPDYTLAGGALWGRKLESSEIVSDLIRRGGEVTALVVENPRKNLRVIISSRGTIYSQKTLKLAETAGELKDLIMFFKKSGLFYFI